MKRLLPFRDYNEHDVINLFALDTANTYISDSGSGDSGVIVKATNGAITNDAVQYVSSAYLGKTDYPFAGRNQYYEVPLKVGVAGSGEAAIGITLFETAMYDENGEKLLYYRQKALENQIVMSGQAVPILTKGTVMLDDSAFLTTIPAPMTNLTVAAGGKFMAVPAVVTTYATGADNAITGISATASNPVYGKVLATGSRVAGATADYFAGAAGATGTYAIVSFDFN